MPTADQDPASRTPGPPDRQAAAAFFDVDNTLMRGASLFHVGLKMYQRGSFRLRDAVGFAIKQGRFLLRGENLKDIHAVRDAAMAIGTGLLVSDVKALGEEVYDEIIASRIWPGTRALADQHLRAGRRVWLVTATPLAVAEVIADRLGLTGALGTVAEVADGAYTGALVGEILHGQAKADAVVELARLEGLVLERCWAYSDSYNDVPLLSLVGNPVAINPDARLRSHAREHGWRVRDYRTGRKAARFGLVASAVAGAAGGSVAAAAAIRRSRVR